jgi:hypothetical protein
MWAVSGIFTEEIVQKTISGSKPSIYNYNMYWQLGRCIGYSVLQSRRNWFVSKNALGY